MKAPRPASRTGSEERVDSDEGVDSDDAPPGRPAVSVIIPVHGDRGLLARTLDCLDAQDLDADWEILVVDNGDNRDLDSTVAGRGRVRVVCETAPGSYAARNAGIAASTAPVLAFTDADCLPRPHWLRAGIAALDGAGPGCFVGGRIHVVTGPRPTGPGLWDSLNGLRQDRYVAQGWAATANLVVARETVARVGVFAGEMLSSGDREWGTRATAAGVRAVYSADAEVDHPVYGSWPMLTRKVRRINGGTQDFRRRRGLPPFDSGELARAARPWVRSAVRASAALPGRWDRTRYVATAVVLQYYSLGHRLILRGTLDVPALRAARARPVLRGRVGPGRATPPRPDPQPPAAARDNGRG